MTLDVNGVDVVFALDTGAQATVLTKSSFDRLDVKLGTPRRILVGAGGGLLKHLGEAPVVLTSKRKSVRCVVSVVDGVVKNLLGIDEIERLGLVSVVSTIGTRPFDPLERYSGVFVGLGTMPDTFSINLREDARPYQLFSPRPIAAGLREKAKVELDKMLSMNVVERVECATDWCSGLTIAPKPNGAIRMCVDLSVLNKSVRRETYPLPRVSDMLARLSEGRVFSKLDANSGFWQVNLDPESRLLTTFITPWGRFCFRRMPFGISSAPEFFQRSMEKILSGLEGVVCLMDDVLIYGRNEAQHWDRVQSVLERIQGAGMTLKKEKCEFARTEISFLGHIVSGDGIKPHPAKVTAILEMKPPSTKKEARRFMGMVNYLSKFSMGLANMAAPINSVTGHSSEWCWEASQRKAFENIKAELTRLPTLCNFDLSRKHRVSADSSMLAVGAVLLQQSDKGDWQPVEYASRKLTEAEQRYAMVEKEALAITWACEKFDYYLVGREFEIETDHKPLVAILGEKDLSKLPLRVQRFKLRMMRYSYNIFHTPGSEMYIADLLSRPTDAVCTGEHIVESDLVEQYVCGYVRSQLLDERRESELVSALHSDDVARECVLQIQRDWCDYEGKDAPVELGKLYSGRTKLTTCGNLILFDSRVYVPKKLRGVYLRRCHEGHQGIEKCRRRARQLFWWPTVSVDIEDFVNKCEICVKRSLIKHQPVVDEPLPRGPWEEVAADLFVFDHDIYLVVIDYYSKWIETAKLPDQSSASVIRELRRMFSCYGVPSRLRSDNGGCFDSEQMRGFAEIWGFVCDTSSPRYPQSNGLAERAVGIVKSLWAGNGDKDAALLAYRTTPLRCGYSPSQLMYARSVRSGLGQPMEEFVDYERFADFEVERKKVAKEKWDKKHRAKALSELVEGERVWIKAPTDLGKEGVVSRKDTHPDSYWVKVGDSEIRRNRKHLFLLEGSSTEAGAPEGGSLLGLSDWGNGNVNHLSDANLVNSASNICVEPAYNLERVDDVNAPDLEIVEEDRVPLDPDLGGVDPGPGGSTGNVEVASPDHVEPEPIVSRVDAEPEPVVSRYGRVIKPVRKDGYMYY